MRPIIGITTSGRTDSFVESAYYKDFYTTPSLYVDAVERAGGIAILLPPTKPDSMNITKILSLIDGIIISGGGDIDPQHYGGNTDHEHVARIDRERDVFELALVKALADSREKDQPMLCVCRGMQVLNVAMGGTMTEHIPDIQPDDMHRADNGFWATHDIDVDGDSALATIMDANTVNTYSGHHQAVKTIGNGLRVVATAADGIIEGLELETHPWAIGVQWHPEKSAAEDTTQQKLFDALVAQASLRPPF
ncbi:MAG: gamma-glutamyl-gamma-aminobutyrate hydrolase family protein [Chloroflexota bacterium]